MKQIASEPHLSLRVPRYLRDEAIPIVYAGIPIREWLGIASSLRSSQRQSRDSR